MAETDDPLTAAECRSMADALETMKNSIVAVYKNRTGNTEKDLETWMSAEKWMGADQALSLKFVDEIAERAAKFLNYVRPGLKNRPAVVPCLHSNSAKRRARRLALLDLR
jgi:hypothetical protein